MQGATEVNGPVEARSHSVGRRLARAAGGRADLAPASWSGAAWSSVSFTASLGLTLARRVLANTIGHARIICVGRYQSCMV
eukprot:COSAG05_NODE_3411_length_2081_cov_17.248624_1_plen_81_part_00